MLAIRIWLFLVLTLGLAGARAEATRPIAQARALALGSLVLVEGYVSVEPGRFKSSSGDHGFAIQDASGGIYVSPAGRMQLATGSLMRVRGLIEDDGHGQIVLKPASPKAIKQIPGRHLPQAAPRRSGDIGAATAGLIVRVRGRVVAPPSADLPWGYKFHLDDGSGAVLVFVAASTHVDPLRPGFILPGALLEVRGFVGRYDEHYEILPRRRADITVLH
ncbi:MAG: hypothetical protein KF778_10705 [Rhodocyclaceae bacterium]|nr:hypothetical protein [Rhodocyclaceae bacterium]MBX3668862.1 hypothetical protein [Rhodocyclaceae bacterium]